MKKMTVEELAKIREEMKSILDIRTQEHAHSNKDSNKQDK